MATRYERIYNNLKGILEEIDPKFYGDDISNAFSHFIIKSKFGLTDEETNSSITDGFNDNGIDAIYIENNKTAHFFQFKFPSKVTSINKGISEAEILKFLNGFESFISNNEEFNSLEWNDLLIQKREEFISEDIYDYELWFTRYTNQPINKSSLSKINRFIKTFKQRTGNTIKCNFILAENCADLYESNIKNVWPDFKIKYKKVLSPFSDEKTEINSAYISLKDIYETFEPIKDKIFEGNVRYLNPKSKINVGIAESIRHKKNDFHLLNNGITIVSDNCYDKTTESLLDVRMGTIINGAQTVGTIINTLLDMEKSEREEYDDSFLFVKIISFNNDKEIINQMVYTLNTQNQMRSSYIISNDLLLKGVQEKINNNTEYFLEIKNNEFNFEKEKDSNFKKMAKNKIDVETFIQTFISFYNKKDLAYLSKNNKSQLFSSENINEIINDLTFEEGIYAYELYLELMEIIKDYRAYRKNPEKDDILKKLEIGHDSINDYRFLNTGNFILLFALGIAYNKYELDPRNEINSIIKILKDLFKDEVNISNVTKVKESFDKVYSLIVDYYKKDNTVPL